MGVRLIAIYTQGRLSAEKEEAKNTCRVGLCTAASMHAAAQVRRRTHTRRCANAERKGDCKKIESERRSRPLHHLRRAPEPPTLSGDPACHVPEGPLSIRCTGHLEPGLVKQIQGCVNGTKENKRLQINVSLPQMNGSRQLSGAIHIHPQLSKAN